MYELIIKNNELIAIKKDNKKETIININEYLKTKSLSLQYFIDYFNYFVNELYQEPLFACKLILESGSFFKKRIPLSNIETHSIKLFDNIDTIRKNINTIRDGDKIYKYYCDDDMDILIAIIYHCISQGYYLRQCEKCGTCFFKDDKKGKYCNECSQTSISNSKNEYSQKKKNNPIEITISAIHSKLNARKNNEYKYILTSSDFNKELEEKRKQKSTGIITDNQFNAWVMKCDKKARLKKKDGGSKL